MQKILEKIPEQDFDEQTQTDLPSDIKIQDTEEKTQEEIIKESEPEKNKIEKIKQPFPDKKPKKEQEESDELRVSEKFEKALSSAIEKKQSKIEPKEPDKKDIKQDKTEEPMQTEIKENIIETDFQTDKTLPEKNGNKISKVLNVKCPECNNIFSLSKENDKKSVICPKCGKEGKIVKEI